MWVTDPSYTPPIQLCKNVKGVLKFNLHLSFVLFSLGSES
jgi:hypothetical protein